MKVVIAHEWLTKFAGSERVVERMVAAYPDACLYAGVVDDCETARRWPDVQATSVLHPRLPAVTTRWPRYGPLFLAAWNVKKLHGDVLLISNHFAAHGAARRFSGVSIAYYHTPMRLAWRPDIEGARVPGVPPSLLKVPVRILQRIDQSAAQHVDYMIANSTAVAERIRVAYGRDATVINPPVDVTSFRRVRRQPRDYFLCFGRLVDYKRTDIAIDVFAENGLPLVVAGDGPARSNLQQGAPDNIRFLGQVSDVDYRKLLSGARALIFPGEEDFGIVPAEALAAGVPVIAYGAGGVLDYLADGVNSVLFRRPAVDALAAAVLQFIDRSECFSVDELRSSVAHLATDCFDARFRTVLGGWLN